ncbi:hypothetical protein C0992_006688 [Termitomyces sp. T32_za158]|nr:hypothetical protein C0992_006688 [Termitomyces sp. T32_za158]
MSANGWRYVVLGGRKPGIKDAMPFFPRGEKLEPFPLPIQCRSYDEAQQVHRLQAFVQSMVNCKLTLDLMKAQIETSAFISQFRGHYWAVFLGKIPGIYTEWSDPQGAEYQLLNVSAPRFASYTQFSTLRGALIYLISKGSDFSGDKEPHHYISDYDPEDNDNYDYDDDVNAEKNYHTHFNSPSPSRLPYAHFKIASPVKPPVSKVSTPKASKTSTLRPTPTSKPSTPVKAKSFTRFHHEEAASLLNLETDFEGISLALSPSPSASPAHASPSIPPIFFHQHIRSLSGIITTLRTPVFPPVQPTLNFGRVVDGYLKSHGYIQEAITAIEQAFLESRGHRSEFMKDICRQGLPRLEAEWIWENIADASYHV